MTRRALDFRGYVKLRFTSRQFVSRPNGYHAWQQLPMSPDACVAIKLHYRQEMPFSCRCVAECSSTSVSSAMFWNLESMCLVSMWHSRGPLQSISTVSWVNMSSAGLLCTCKTDISASLCADTHVGETSGVLFLAGVPVKRQNVQKRGLRGLRGLRGVVFMHFAPR